MKLPCLSMLHYRLPQTAHLQIRRWPGSGKKKCLGTCDDTELARVWPSSTYILRIPHCCTVNQTCQELAYCMHHLVVYVTSIIYKSLTQIHDVSSPICCHCTHTLHCKIKFLTIYGCGHTYFSLS